MKLGLVGVNPLSQVVMEIVREKKPKTHFFYFDDDRKKQNTKPNGINVIGTTADVKKSFENGRIDAACLCIGEKHLARKKELTQQYKSAVAFPVIRHGSSVVSPSAKIMPGCILSFGTIVGMRAKIESHCALWAGAVIEHDSVVGTCCYIGPKVTISGFVKIGECTLIGSGAVVLPEVKIGAHCIVGAGAVVTRDVPDHTTVAGSPARKL